MKKTTTPHSIKVDGREIATDSEGYLVDLADWSEEFAQALARQEGLALTDAHWEVIRFLRAYYHEHAVQPQVRVMIRHFTKVWDAERGSNHHLHDLFPRGGPQKQGNRLAGLLRTKGEH
ncbi:MAG TPA: TusE/DsrC/DsvC family sulfur relay protein [Burkholderiaceae bacterium]|nr:TusE/DsrC/DsvC family sulfur relay protein [Burkholderiaceae bacterium]HRP28235.1 TusE/DsrC/DsvC family sulfur relay protein [Burkholderiaceae bacterium]